MHIKPEFSNAYLHWDADNLPHSLLYGDIYFSKADALAESTHVFLDGNQLAQRWQDMQTQDFVIGELGFGAGLNFLNTCRLWQATAPAHACLHYVACELHPFTRADMQRLHAKIPDLRFFSEMFLQSYPDHTPGVHQMEFVLGRHRVVLTLLYGDAERMLTAMYPKDGFRMDCWFMDGFSPKLNPAMWQPSLLQAIWRLSKAGTTLTTYSVAGSLRQSLTEAGFTLTKLKGYANKRHMLFAKLQSATDEHSVIQVQPQTLIETQDSSRAKTVCIIGAGLAGCSTAFMLARSGWKVIVLEREGDAALQGSGNAQGILHYRPSKADTAEREFNLHAYLYAIRHYRMLSTVHQFVWQQCGMLQLAVNDKLLARYEALIQSGQYAAQVLQLLDAGAATEIAGRLLALPALYLPESGWMSPRTLCELYLQHPAITLQTGVDALALEQARRGWKINSLADGDPVFFEADNIVLCNSADAYAFSQTRHYPLVCNLGQVDYYAAQEAGATNTVLCGQGYILPSNGEIQSVGGSFFIGDRSADAISARKLSHVDAIRSIDQAMGNVLAGAAPSSQRIGMRCATPDRMPIVGPATQSASEKKTFLPGLFINVAHGSHGLTRTPICAAYIASLLNYTPFPLDNSAVAVIHSSRF